MKEFKRPLFLFGLSVLLAFQTAPSLTALSSASITPKNHTISGQDVPRGITYKKASEPINAEAQSWLEQMIRDPRKVPTWLVGNLVTVGPMLWREFDPKADSRFGDTGRFMLMIQTSKPFVVPGGVLRTEAAREAFWDVLWRLYPELAKASVRKAKAPELSYYWAMIPYDIEEPFFTLDTGKKQFIVNFLYEKNGISSIWIDLVGNLEDLASPKK
jgi:hypothetical protein